ncbi:MAG TPA: ATP-dependent DNA ligase [Gaiellaceae bacterium]|nr:ATP-dependent DNA ligase [Gaiellaceae bacterium]
MSTGRSALEGNAGCTHRPGDAEQLLLEDVARTSSVVAETASRLGKIGAIASCLGGLRPDEVPVAVAYLAGELPHAPIGVGWAALRELPSPADTPTLELLEVDAALRRIGETTGPGSQALRRSLLGDLFSRATGTEQRFLVGLLTGELRQGALAGVMADAVAKAAQIPAAAVRRAQMLSGDLGVVAGHALAEGESGLARFRLDVLRPLQPMLAQTAETLDDALARVGSAAVEWKLDGARIQMHRRGDEVRVFTRNLADVTGRVPEIVELSRALPGGDLVLDGEAIALDDERRPRPFQVTMSRFGSRTTRAVPLSAVFFDVLHANGEDLLDRPAAERFAALDALLPQELRVPRLETADVAEAERFLVDALAHGHEGVMVKSLGAPYEAGRRGAGWLKVKQAHTLDLVVLAAEWGHGRRQGWLSNLHLGARNPATGEFVMLGKTFKGMTDAMLAWQTERLLELETHRDGYTVYVRPELVVEIAFDGVQASSRYPGGLALRFARVKGYREDKRADESDTIETVRAIHAGQTE